MSDGGTDNYHHRRRCRGSRSSFFRLCKWPLLFLALCCLEFQGMGFTVGTFLPNDQEALVQLKRHLLETNKVHRGAYVGWNDSNPSLCDWMGITCEKVVNGGYNLSGLHQLQVVDVTLNLFDGCPKGFLLDEHNALPAYLPTRRRQLQVFLIRNRLLAVDTKKRVNDLDEISWGNLSPSLRPLLEGHYPPLPFID